MCDLCHMCPYIGSFCTYDGKVAFRVSHDTRQSFLKKNDMFRLTPFFDYVSDLHINPMTMQDTSHLILAYLCESCTKNLLEMKQLYRIELK